MTHVVLTQHSPTAHIPTKPWMSISHRWCSSLGHGKNRTNRARVYDESNALNQGWTKMDGIPGVDKNRFQKFEQAPSKAPAKSKLGVRAPKHTNLRDVQTRRIDQRGIVPLAARRWMDSTNITRDTYTPMKKNWAVAMSLPRSVNQYRHCSRGRLKRNKLLALDYDEKDYRSRCRCPSYSVTAVRDFLIVHTQVGLFQSGRFLQSRNLTCLCAHGRVTSLPRFTPTLCYACGDCTSFATIMAASSLRKTSGNE